MDCKFLSPIFTEFHNIFQNTMNELFVNKCFCDEASLYFFVIKTSEEPEAIYFVEKDGTTETVTHNAGQSIKNSIHSYMAKKIGTNNYRLPQACDTFMDTDGFRIACVFSSETMDHNEGRFLFQCVCEDLAALFNNLLAQEKINFTDKPDVIEQIVEKWSVQEHYLIQQSIQNAAAETCQYLQKFYMPLNLPFIIQLSGEYYERSECRSNMVLLFQDAVNSMKKSDFTYYFDNGQSATTAENRIEFIPKNIRLIRKLLQITQQDLCLVLGEDAERQTFKVLGICKESYFENRKSAFPYIKIDFRNHMKWDFYGNGTYIFSYRNGQYKINNQATKELLMGKLQKYFEDSEKDYDTVAEEIMDALLQKHGTMVTIMNRTDAQNQARRLGEKEYGLLNSNPNIQKKNIQQLSNIDGSVIMDTSGKIYGIGMILDGSVGLETGRLARGARYNSTIKYNEYLRNLNVKAMTFIISEDGTLDIQYS